MATRAELLDTFEIDLAREGSFLLPAPGANAMPDGRSYIHQSYDSLDGQHDVEWHVSLYWDEVQDNVVKAQFYVKDRGEAGEEATWFKGQNPKPPAPEPTFQQEMTTWLQSQIDQTFGSLTLRHIESTTANNDIERGTANVVMENGTGEFVRKSVAIWQDASDNWQFQEIVQ